MKIYAIYKQLLKMKIYAIYKQLLKMLCSINEGCGKEIDINWAKIGKL